MTIEPYLITDTRGDESCTLVLARNQREALLLWALVADHNDPIAGSVAPEGVSIMLAEWQYGESSDPKRTGGLPKRVVGVWSPPDAIWAGYGVQPDGYEFCECCGLVVHEDDYEPDEDLCKECVADNLAAG